MLNVFIYLNWGCDKPPTHKALKERAELDNRARSANRNGNTFDIWSAGHRIKG